MERARHRIGPRIHGPEVRLARGSGVDVHVDVVPSTVNVRGASPVLSSAIVAPASVDRQSGRNAKSASSTDGGGSVHGSGGRSRRRTRGRSRRGRPGAQGRSSCGGAYPPGSRGDRVGYHRRMVRAAHIEPSRPLPVAPAEAVRMALRPPSTVGLEERAASLEALDQARREALGARSRDPVDGPHDPRGATPW